MVIQSSPSAREPVVLRDVIAILRRRSGLLALFAVAGLGAGAAYHAHQPRLYRAEAVMALDVRRIQGMPIDQVVTPLPQENPVLRTELDRIGSRVMAQRVLAKLAAEGIDPFGGVAVPGEVRPVNPPVPTPGETAANPDVTHSGGTPGPQVRAEDAAAFREDRLRAGLKVVNDGRSYTIYIAYTAGDPDIAARVANAYARAYLAYQDDVQIDATRRVSDWLSNRLKVMAARLEQAEQEAERF
ncbi:MAG TPA: lipopolysaccharide biosynthesis protein, partial [Kaistia sp.]|nr:lipopolysaccharide biosynthesis protein [Kaistia sp.]